MASDPGESSEAPVPSDGGDDEAESLRRGVYERGTDEFSRVLTFSDGIFAIAMTLLVAGIVVPDGPGSLAERLGDEWGQIFSFFLSFVVIGYYWLAHHRLLAMVQRVRQPFIQLNLLYLALIAFLPFPTALIGQEDEAALAVVIYAATLALASLVETVLFGYLRRHGDLRIPISEEGRRAAVAASLVPVVVFAVSIPVAFVNTTAATLIWIAIFPLEKLLDRFGPTAEIQ